MSKSKQDICSICGNEILSPSCFGPGPHKFHAQCENGAENYIAMLDETKRASGGHKAKRMALWPSAAQAGIKFPFPPFRKVKDAKED